MMVIAALMFFSSASMAATDISSQAPQPVQPSQQSSPQNNSNNTPPKFLSISAVTMPLQYAFVKSDSHAFEAQTWQNAGYSGGLKDFSLHYKSGDDIEIDADGHALSGNHDFQGDYSIAKKDEGYLKFDFKQFRKYYDIHGGTYYPFSTLTSPSLGRDLFLDIGHFGIEAGMTRPDLPNVSVFYEHDYKTGAKSMLDWASVTVGSVVKKISPSWEEIDDTTDTLGVKADYTEQGYHLTADQRWEIMRGKTKNYSTNLTNTGSGTTTATTDQDQAIETNAMTTTLGADKWYWEDKVFASSAYRFEHLKNQDNQNIQLAPASGTFYPNSIAHNTVNLNSWVMNMMASPWSWLGGTASVKAETSQQDSNSYVPDATYPSTMNYTINNAADSNTVKFSESFGLRFKAIPRTALYTNLDFEQSQNHQIENLNYVPLTGTNYNMGRDAIISQPTTTWTIGGDFMPLRFMNLTSQFRLRDTGMKFDEQSYYPATGSHAPPNGLVFLDTLQMKDINFTQRATFYLCGWAQTSFRYLFDDMDYTTRAYAQTSTQQSHTLANTFIYDLSVFPLSNLSMMGSFSKQLASTTTPAESAAAAATNIPSSNSDSNTWMLSSDYQPHKKVHLTSTLFYTIANNFNGIASSASPLLYGTNFTQMGLTAGCKWEIRKDLSLQPQYGFNRYAPNKNSAAGGYDAQTLSLAIISAWG